MTARTTPGSTAGRGADEPAPTPMHGPGCGPGCPDKDSNGQCPTTALLGDDANHDSFRILTIDAPGVQTAVRHIMRPGERRCGGSGRGATRGYARQSLANLWQSACSRPSHGRRRDRPGACSQLTGTQGSAVLRRIGPSLRLRDGRQRHEPVELSEHGLHRARAILQHRLGGFQARNHPARGDVGPSPKRPPC